MTAVIKGKGIYGFVDTSGLFAKGHTVERWHAKIGEEVVVVAKVEAPVRTGALRQSINSSGTSRPGGPTSNFLEVRVGARRRYSRFVHEGTTGPITSHSGKRMGPMNNPTGISGYAEPANPVGGSMGGTKVGARLTGASKQIGFAPYQYVVRGQDPNPFLSRALSIVGTKHRWRGGRTRVVR